MNRLFFVFFFLFCFFILVIQRLFLIQILNPNKTLNIQKYIQLEKRLPLRGEIFDRNGQPLVVNKQVYDLYANVDLLRKNRQLQNTLKKELSLKESTITAYLAKKNWIKIKTKVSENQYDSLKKYYPAYLNFESQWVRYYPEGSVSAQLLGFLGKNDVGQPKGYLGVEGYYDRELKGMPYISENETDLLGVPFTDTNFDQNNSFSGFDLNLSIDINVQRIVEQELYKGLEKFQAKKVCSIIIEPYSGEIIALGCVPGFDPEVYYKYGNSDFINPLISSVYEPGSTFKPLIVAMGLETNKIKANTKLVEKGPVKIGEYEISTWDHNYRDKLTISQVLEKSSNVGMVKIIQKMKQKTVDDYLEKLGLREMTNIELEGEVNSLIKEREDWYDIDYATLSFGQGMAITPLQLVRAFTTLANDGILVHPTVLKNLYDPKNGLKINSQDYKKNRVFSEQTTKELKTMLKNAVNKSEAYWPNKPVGYNFCGKTGTAQIPIKGVYDPNKTIASFIGFLPCDKPKFLMLVVYKEPQKSIWGSETAAPTFFEIAKSLILYYNIAPDIKN